jgi:hypothetical protein
MKMKEYDEEAEINRNVPPGTDEGVNYGDRG